MSKVTYTMALLADLHLGVLPIEQQKKELDRVLFHNLLHMKKLDLIVICGDTFDHKIYVNDTTTDLCIWFFKQLFSVANIKDAKIRVVYGTQSHEANQYNLIPWEYDVDVKVIKTASEEEIFPGVSVLYLPEEHIYDKHEFYNDFLYQEDQKNKYDYIFGHGIIDEIMSTGKKEKESSKRLHVPHFTVGELLQVCKGKVYFGHYHIHSEMKEKVFYISSFSRWQFGEEEPKGYMVSTYTDGKIKEVFVENTEALRYKTFRYGYQHEIFTSQEELLHEFQRLENLISMDAYDKIRCMVNIPLTIENPGYYVTMFTERFRHNQKIKVEFTNGYVEEKKKINKEELQEVTDHYHFVLEDLEIKDKISKFVELKLNREIPADKVKTYLDEPLKVNP